MAHRTTTATRGTVTKAPIDLGTLDDGALLARCQELYARLATGDVKCDQAPDDATRLRWESAWGVADTASGPAGGLLAEYQAAVDELHGRGIGE